jgi:hypothetical protein
VRCDDPRLFSAVAQARRKGSSTSLSQTRNGGRHRCQPPLRRAKDLPVFVTWWIKPFGLPTRSRSWLTSSGVAFHLAIPSFEEPDLSTRLRRPKARWSFDRSGLVSSRYPIRRPSTFRSQNSPVFRGPSWDNPYCVPLRSPNPTRRFRSRVARQKDYLFRRLFPADPEKNPKVLPIACRRRSVLLSPAASILPLPAFRGGWDFRPDHLSTMHPASESRKQNFW